jgi:hypothetical protein
MSYQKDREEFIRVMLEEFPGRAHGEVIAMAKDLMRKASTSERIATVLCSVEMSEKRQARIEAEDERNDAAIKRVCDAWGMVAVLSGDPRGYTVKVKLPSGRSNTWGGSEHGWGVPAREPRINF